MSKELIVSSETPNVRVRSGRLNFLFQDTTPEQIQQLYRTFVEDARRYFGDRWQSATSATLTEEEFGFLTRELALHWLYFRVVNRLPPVVSEADWKHPQSRRIVARHIRECFGADSDESLKAGAEIIGISVEAYRDWLAEDRQFEEMF